MAKVTWECRSECLLFLHSLPVYSQPQIFHCLFYRNPGVRTIEEDLLEAMSKAKAFPPEMKTNLGQVCDW